DSSIRREPSRASGARLFPRTLRFRVPCSSYVQKRERHDDGDTGADHDGKQTSQQSLDRAKLRSGVTGTSVARQRVVQRGKTFRKHRISSISVRRTEEMLVSRWSATNGISGGCHKGSLW